MEIGLPGRDALGRLPEDADYCLFVSEDELRTIAHTLEFYEPPLASDHDSRREEMTEQLQEVVTELDRPL